MHDARVCSSRMVKTKQPGWALSGLRLSFEHQPEAQNGGAMHPHDGLA